MNQPSTDGPAGAVIVTATKSERSFNQLTFDVLLPTSVERIVSVRSLGRDRLELDEADAESRFMVEAEVSTTPTPDATDCPLVAKAQQILGQPLCCGSMVVVIPGSTFRRCEYIAMDIGDDDLRTAEEAERGIDWRRSVNAIHLEFHKRKLKRTNEGAKALFLLVTPRYVQSRMDSILSRYRVDRTGSPVAVEAIENILFGLYSGNVNGLLTL